MSKFKERFAIFFEKFLAFLRVRTVAAGLEIGDRVIRLVRFDGKVWQMQAIRLEPDVMENGEIKNRPALIAALSALRAKAEKGDRSQKVNVVLCPSSLPMYTQVFELPTVQGQSFDEAVELNLAMVSPLEADKAHAGWQILGRDETTLQMKVLSAFADKKLTDELVDALFESGFLTMAVESRALALTRMLREKGAGVEVHRPYLFVNIDNVGIDFLVMRNGMLYFEFANQWKDMMDEKGEISIPKFESSLETSLRQVLNFYGQHWTEPLAAVILSAVALGDEAERAVAAVSPLPVVRLTLVMGQPISSEWLVALGCSLRGTGLRAKDKEINLLGDDSLDRFHEEQLINFMRFWRVVVPISMAILVLTFFGADFFLGNTRQGIESRSDFNLGGGQTGEIATLENQAQDFNQKVALISSVEGMLSPKSPVLKTVLGIADTHKVTVNRLSFSSFSSPLNLSGSANAQDAVIAFKGALGTDPRFSNVNLPLTAVQLSGNTVVFTMTFLFNPSVPAPAAATPTAPSPTAMPTSTPEATSTSATSTAASS